MLFTVSREGRTAEIFLTQGKQLTAFEPYRGNQVSDTVMLRYSTLKPIHPCVLIGNLGGTTDNKHIRPF